MIEENDHSEQGEEVHGWRFDGTVVNGVEVRLGGSFMNGSADAGYGVCVMFSWTRYTGKRWKQVSGGGDFRFQCSAVKHEPTLVVQLHSNVEN